MLQERRMKTISELISRPRRWTKFNMTFFFWGSEPALLTLLHGAARRIWTCDLDLWTAVALSSGCRLLRYLCSQWTQKKEEMGTSWPAVLPAHIILWALTHNCKGLRKIGTFYCFCSNHHFICLPFSPSCPYSSLYSSVSHPSFTPYLLSVSLSSLHLSLSPPSSSPSFLVSYLNCSAHRRTQSGLSPCRLYCQHQFCWKEHRREERKEQQEKRGNCRDLCFPFIVSSQWGSVTPTATAERKQEELCSMLNPDAPV